MRIFVALFVASGILVACGQSVPPAKKAEAEKGPVEAPAPAWKSIGTLAAAIQGARWSWNEKTRALTLNVQYLDLDDVAAAKHVEPFPKRIELKGTVNKDLEATMVAKDKLATATVRCDDGECTTARATVTLATGPKAALTLERKPLVFAGTKRVFPEPGTLPYVDDCFAELNKRHGGSAVKDGGTFFEVLLAVSNAGMRKTDPDYFESKSYAFVGQVGRDRTIQMGDQTVNGALFLGTAGERAQANVYYDAKKPRLEIAFLNPKDAKKEHESHSLVFGQPFFRE